MADAGAADCANCGRPRSGAYCAHCGEAAPDTAARGAARTFTRIRSSLNALASPPGRLTRDWIAGRRVRYLAPLPLFLYTNIAFFLIQWASGVSVLSWPLRAHMASDILGIPASLSRLYPGPQVMQQPQTIAVFNALEVVHAKALVIVMLPMFAVAMLAAPLCGTRRMRNALTFSAHFYTYALITLCALFPLVSLALRALAFAGVDPTPHAIDVVVSALQALLLAGYLLPALGTLTPWSLPLRLAYTLLLLGAVFLVLGIYHVIVFAATLASL